MQKLKLDISLDSILRITRLGSVGFFLFSLECFFLGDYQKANFFVGLLATTAVVFTAVKSFILMDETTAKTVSSIVNELKTFTTELKNTNLLLKELTNKPELRITFKGKKKDVTLKSGEEHEVQFILWNHSLISARDSEWWIFLPSDFELIENAAFKTKRNICDDVSDKLHDTQSLYFKETRTTGRSSSYQTVKFKSPKSKMGVIKVPIITCSEGNPDFDDALVINLIG